MLSLNNLMWDPYFLAAMGLFGEFMLLALLGAFFVQILHWDAAFHQRQDNWMRQMKAGTRQLRSIRRLLDKTGGELPELPLSPGMRRQWLVLRWIGRALLMTRQARS